METDTRSCWSGSSVVLIDYGALGDVREFLEPTPLSAGMDTIGARFDRMARQIKDVLTHAAVRAALLMGLLFVLMLLYRAITNRFLTLRSAT